MFNPEVWEEWIFALGRGIRKMIFFFLIIRLVIGVFYRIDPIAVDGWFAHELAFSNYGVLIFNNGVLTNPILATIFAPISVVFEIEHMVWSSVFGPAHTLTKDLIVIAIVVGFLYFTLNAKTKSGEN